MLRIMCWLGGEDRPLHRGSGRAGDDAIDPMQTSPVHTQCGAACVRGQIVSPMPQTLHNGYLLLFPDHNACVSGRNF
jgi:hypothetical protein